MKLWLIRFSVFSLLFFVVEFSLRLSGLKPGVVNNKFFITKRPKYTGIYIADSSGMTFFSGNRNEIPDDYIINRQGFRSKFDFEKSIVDSIKDIGNTKTVMLIGDSYAEGCCVSPINKSFADILGRDSRYTVLNFGIGSTDLLQYKLVLQNYLNKLKPDLVVIAFYLGNDIAWYERPVTPNIPKSFTFEKFLSLNPSIPFFSSKKNFALQNPDETLDFYLNNYTLLGDNRNLVLKWLRNSVVLSRLYIGVREKWYMAKWFLQNKNNIEGLTGRLISEIQTICNVNNTKLIFVCIPSPNDISKAKPLNEVYGKYFLGNNCYFPDVTSFNENDYDGKESSSHFNDAGHLKFSTFLEAVVSEQF